VTGMDLVDRLLAVHRSLDDASLPHAFGGALALAWCTHEVRATIDLDVNVFVAIDRATEVLDALPDGVERTGADLELLARDGQVRVWWERTPVDLFLNTTDFHAQVATRARTEPFAGDTLPFLACSDLAVFKAFFDRTKDWADLEAMVAAGSLDAAAVLGTLVLYLGGDDPRVARLRGLVARI
jgi:hypothetical protein